MAEISTDDFLTKQKETLNKKRAGIVEKRDELDAQIEAVDAEIARIDAYFNASKPAGKRKSTGTRAPREGGIREALITLIGTKTGGMTRGEIIEARSAKGNKSAEQSISNALSNLKKAGTLKQGGDGRYTAA